MQITLPENYSLLARRAESVLTELGTLTLTAPFFIFSSIKSNFDPSTVKKDKRPILLIHGDKSNEIQWLPGRYHLSDTQLGSVFTLNLDGLLTNQLENGIDDCAEKVSQKIQQIAALTGRTDIDLVGHSMGGLVAAYYKENLAARDNIEVKKIIGVSVPWNCASLLNKVSRIFSFCCAKPKRYRQMRNENRFLERLREQIYSPQQTCKYYNIYSRDDLVVTDDHGRLEIKPERQRRYIGLGHNGMLLSPSVWNDIRRFLTTE